jgi:hypothetical protein
MAFSVRAIMCLFGVVTAVTVGCSSSEPPATQPPVSRESQAATARCECSAYCQNSTWSGPSTTGTCTQTKGGWGCPLTGAGGACTGVDSSGTTQAGTTVITGCGGPGCTSSTGSGSGSSDDNK